MIAWASSWLRAQKYPVVRQHEEIDCGPAALLAVLRYWRGDDSLAHIRELAQTDSRGTTLLGLAQAAERLGFTATGATGEYDDLLREPMPCIAHVVNEDGLQHYVTLYQVRPDWALVGDPAVGLRRWTRETFTTQWRQKAILRLTPAGDLVRRTPQRWTDWVLAHLRDEQTWLVQSLFLGAIYTVLGLFTAILIQWLIDRFIPERRISSVLAVGATLIAVQFLRGAAGYLRSRFTVELNARVNVRINEDFLQHLFRLPTRFFEARRMGDITARIQDGVKLQQGLLLLFGAVMIDGLIVVGSIVFIFYLSRPLGLLAIAAVPVYVLAVTRSAQMLKHEHNEVLRSYGHVEASYFDSLGGINDIHTYGAGEVFASRNTALYRRFQERSRVLGLRESRVSTVIEFTGGVVLVGSLMAGAVLVVHGDLLIGQLVATYALLSSLLPSATRIVNAGLSLQGAAAAADRLMDLLLAEPEPETAGEHFQMTRGLMLDRCRFAWAHTPPLLSNLSLAVERGRITGIWGATGAGKSTIVKLIERKYAPTDGKLLLDGRPVAEIGLRDYRRQIGVISESTRIFNGSVADNILLGRPIGGLEELLQRVDAMGLAHILARFEAGLFTPIGEGGRRVSSGERQLIGLMRALFDEPAILVVDEGLNSVDVATAQIVLQTLERYARNHAVLLISHDLSYLMRTDYLYLLEHGQVTAEGSPQQLIDTSPLLRGLAHVSAATPA